MLGDDAHMFMFICACHSFHKRFIFLPQYFYIGLECGRKLQTLKNISFFYNRLKIAITNDRWAAFLLTVYREMSSSGIEDERNEWVKTKVNELLMQNRWKLEEIRNHHTNTFDLNLL